MYLIAYSNRYKPPITSASTSPNLPETPDEISEELRKQESLLNQIHSEMNAGFVSKKREEQLWEVQRIITQLKVCTQQTTINVVAVPHSNPYNDTNVQFLFECISQRKLRSFERRQDSMQKSIDDGIGDVDTSLSYEVTAQLSKTKSICSDDESLKTLTIVSTESNTETKTSPQDVPERTLSSMGNELSLRLRDKSQPLDDCSAASSASNETDKITIHENGMLMLPETHPEYLNLIRLQLENQELMQWKHRLERRIQSERTEVTRLKAILNARQANSTASAAQPPQADPIIALPDGSNYERVVAQYVLENTLLEQKKNYLAKEIFEENQKLVQLQVELAIRQFQI